jgi:hypothetical protein
LRRLFSEVSVPTDLRELSEPLSLSSSLEASESSLSEASASSEPSFLGRPGSLPGSSIPRFWGFCILAMVLYGPGLVEPVVVYSLVSSA